MSDKTSPLIQLEEHLKLARVSGLPENWFQDAPLPFTESGEDSQLMSSVKTEKEDSVVMLEGVGQMDWDELNQTVQSCTKCRLCEGRNKAVFGSGKRSSPLVVFVGEGPGAEEDRTGEPFVGRAGQLLTGAITKGMGLTRDEVFICNVVKCRPPENRAPLPDEVAACTPYLYRQLELMQPKVIVSLGQPAQLALSGVQLGITKLRGQWQNYRGFKLMPTFHPAYLLRNPPAKKFFWEDLQAVMAEVGLPIKEPLKESLKKAEGF